ncbi:hypothetical protein [Hymenobacter cellulosivorans]|uniref:DUF3303 domain-containing protein n=1 Tax=Hymenobacter cellulosivorans TaxID=2932249 RepID=A0ABY4F839_9BACT|nr:hypothetical protein [Hymenobacter cellulosivorans]UOQ52366.1 hypothetical protein MUN80_21730 [Hymenobacter cellulosivorans]
MTLYECTFCALSTEEQLQALWRKGTFLAARWAGSDRVYLYHMSTFFAEVCCDLSQKQLRIRAFTSPQNLEAYAASVTLDNLEQ